MGRRRKAIKEVVMSFGFFFTILIFVLVLAASIVMLLPVGILWLVSPTVGDRILVYVCKPLLRLMDFGSRLDTWV